MFTGLVETVGTVVSLRPGGICAVLTLRGTIVRRRAGSRPVRGSLRRLSYGDCS